MLVLEKKFPSFLVVQDVFSWSRRSFSLLPVLFGYLIYSGGLGDGPCLKSGSHLSWWLYFGDTLYDSYTLIVHLMFGCV